MSESPIDIRFEANARQAIEAIESVERTLISHGLHRAVLVAKHNGYSPVRFVVGRRLGRWLGIVGTDMTIRGVPVVVDEATELGFGLVTRPPST